jgi:DNA topoisomerase-1
MQIETLEDLYTHEEKSANAARLSYNTDEQPGYSRQKSGTSFRYFTPTGRPLIDAAKREWIKSLAIPPAWTDVWISPDPKNHLLVTGRDDKDRKQYIYHPKWREIRDLLNFYRLVLFGDNLPTIRRRIKKQLEEKALCHEKVVAVIINIIDKTYIRIGNETYAEANESYGITTMRNEHVTVRGSHLTFEFVGKSGKEHTVEIDDAQLATIVKACLDIPEDHLFSYEDDDGVAWGVSSDEVNAFLREITELDFTAKSFRTWGGTLTTYEYLLAETKKPSDKKVKKVINEAIEATAEVLGNTKAVSKAHYIHPHLVASYEKGTFEKYLTRVQKKQLTSKPHITLREQELIELLKLLFEDEWEKAIA